MARGNIVRFHFLAFYPEGVEPWREDEAGKPLRIGQSIEIEVDPRHDLGGQMRLAIEGDPAIRSSLKTAIGAGYDRLELLPRGAAPSDWAHAGSTAYVSHPVRWWIDPNDQTVMSVDLLHRYPYLTLEQLDELVDLELIEGDPRELLVVIDTGLGGGDGLGDLASWLLQHGVDIGIGVVGEGLLRFAIGSITRRVRGSVRDRRARRLAAIWEHKNFFYPKDLREFIDARPEWDPTQVARLLGLAPIPAGRLLRSLGYEPTRSGRWRVSTGWRARRRRRDWIRHEDDSPDLDEHPSSKKR